VRAAHAAGLTIISVTDHDTTGGVAEATHAAAAIGIEVVAGIEITAVAEGRDLHMLGYFIDPSSPGLREFLQRQRADRVRRIVEMSDRLSQLGMPIDSAPILADADRGRSVGRPQVASALLAAGHVETRDDAFRRFLEFGGPAYVPREGASPEEVIAVIHGSNGLASVAHPGVSNRDHVLPRLAESGLDAIEVRHPDHDPEKERHYRQLARELGLRVTGGSDFHGDTGHRTAILGSVTLPAADYEAFAGARPHS
jgi:predicted metal-dependent phosphoesterase TrpH